MRFFSSSLLAIASVLAAVQAQVDFVHSPCTTPPGGEMQMQPSVAFDLTSQGMNQFATAILRFLQKDLAQPGVVLVPYVTGEYALPIGGNIEYNITNVKLNSINIGSYSNNLDMANQVTNVDFEDINASLSLDYSFFQNNFLHFPNGKGSVDVIASGGHINLGIGNLPAGKIIVQSSDVSFASYNIQLTTGFDFLLNLLLWAFKNQVTGLLNTEIQKMVPQTLNSGLAEIDQVVPHSVTILKPPYTTSVGFAYATPQVFSSSIRQYLEFEFTPKGSNGSTTVGSCNCPIARTAIPSLEEENGQDYDVVVGLPESTVNTLFWTLQQNNMLSFTVPADKEIVLSTFFPDHPCSMIVEAAQPPVIYFNQTNPASAVADIYLKYTAVETKTGNIFTTFTAEHLAFFNISLKSSDFDPSTGYSGASVNVVMQSVNVTVSNIKFYGIAVPDWTVSIITSKLESMIGRAVEEVVNFALADGIPLPFPGFVGVKSGVVEFVNAESRVKLSIEVL